MPVEQPEKVRKMFFTETVNVPKTYRIGKRILSESQYQNYLRLAKTVTDRDGKSHIDESDRRDFDVLAQYCDEKGNIPASKLEEIASGLALQVEENGENWGVKGMKLEGLLGYSGLQKEQLYRLNEGVFRELDIHYDIDYGTITLPLGKFMELVLGRDEKTLHIEFELGKLEEQLEKTIDLLKNREELIREMEGDLRLRDAKIKEMEESAQKALKLGIGKIK